MGVRLKTFLLLTIAVVVSIVSYVCWYANAEQRRMEEELLALVENYSYAFHAEFKSVRERMLQLALFAANDDHVQELMAAAATAVVEEGGGAGGVRSAAIRQKLYRHLHSSINQLAEKFDIVTLHFHLTPGALSFLRFHSPDEMGDRLDDVRPMIVAAGRQQQPFSGFEIGRYFSGVRAAAPIFAPADAQGAGKCVGVVEFGTPIDTLLGGLHANRPWLNAAAFVYDASLQRDMVSETYAAATTGRSIVTSEGERLQMSATTSRNIENFLQLSDFKAGLSGAQSFRFASADAIYNAAILPLDDFKAQQNWKNPAVGRVVVWQDVSSRIAQYNGTVASLIRYGAFLFFALEGCIYLGLYLVSNKLKDELEHQRQLERVSGKALAAVSSIGQLEQQPQLQLNRILQEQLRDAVEQLGAELGMFISTRQADGEYRILAVSDMVWSTAQSVRRYERARTQLMQQGYIPMKMEGNILVQAMEAGAVRVLEHSDCSRDIIPFLPEGHPRIDNGILIPVKVADTTLGLLVLANCGRGFGTKEQIVAKAYAGAAALLMHSDLREVERLSAIETARVKDELFRNLNHELRTPLNTINGMGKKLAETGLDSIQTHALKQITEAARRLTHLIEEVLLLAGLDKKEKANIHTVPFRPSALLTSIVAEFAVKARERGIELRCSWDKNLPLRFNGDSEKIAVILRQLVGNAIKFSRDAEVCLTLKDVTDSPSSGRGNADSYILRFAVADHGIGIAKEQHALIFEPFYQCDTSRAREFEGAGLGLSVVRKLAAILGSEIKLESEVGVGSTFYFDLNLAANASEHEDGTRTATARADAEGKQQEFERGNEAQLQELLRELEEPLIHSRPRPCNAISTRLKARRWPRSFASEVDKIINFMDKYRYPEALDILHKVQIQLEEYVGTDAGQDMPADS